MCKKPSEDEDQDSSYYHKFGMTFVRGKGCKIYKPESSDKEPESGRKSNIPDTLSVEVKRDSYAFTLTALAVIISAATLFVVCMYTWYSRGQWNEMKRAADGTTKAAGAAERAAGTAYDSLQDAKDSFQIQNRPYMIITSNSGIAGFVRNQNIFDMTKINVTYGNIGKTPAYDAFVFSRFTIERFPKDDPSRTLNNAIEDAYKPIAKDDANIARHYSEIEKVDVPPGANAPFVTVDLGNGPLTEADKVALGQTPNTVLLLSIGRIHYKAFDKTKSYSTDFCFYYFGTNPSIWHYCPTHNLVR